MRDENHTRLLKNIIESILKLDYENLQKLSAFVAGMEVGKLPYHGRCGSCKEVK
jgi:hypothetical protein